MHTELTQMPNVGPAVARKLERLGISRPEDLRGRDGAQLFAELCAQDGRGHDPCLLDTFVAAVAYVNEGDDRPWWEFSRERKARTAGALAG
ncbi:MAG: helix-hairpin-helix domain-containing protein [Solirubrobacteraceae bacterium]